jgi:hypothetical protein
MMLLQPQPFIVRIAQDPAQSTSITDVLIGALGLTGVLILAALVLGALLGGTLIGIKLLRARFNVDPASDSDTIHIV